MSKRLALIIGNSLYRDKTLSKLSSPDADVGALTDTLLDPSLGGFDDVKLLVNSASHIVRREIFNFFSRKTRTDMLLFYFTGHGVLDDRGRLYLSLKDTDTKALRGTAIPASYITDEMDNSRSRRQVLILDCCHSGAFARGSKGATGANVGTASTFEGSGFGRVVLTASDATQYAWEGNQIIGEAVNSLFTHFIIKGIQTGEADVNQDGNISIDEIYDYAYSRILEETPKQTPGKWSFKEQGELVIAKSPVAEIQYEPSPPPSFLNEEEQKQMQKWYMDGLSAFWLEDWGGAIQKFEAILQKDPDYPDVVEKLEEARTHKKHVDLYNQAFAKSEEGEFEESIKLLESLIAEVPDYKDAASKLEEIQERKTLADLCSEARQLFESKKYQAVVRIFEKIHAIDPEYEDPDGLLEKSKEEEKKIQHHLMLEDLYKRGILELDAGRLEEAKIIFSKILEKEENYRDAEKLLERINMLISPEKASQVEEKIDARQKDVEAEAEIQKVKVSQEQPDKESFRLPPAQEMPEWEQKHVVSQFPQRRGASALIKWAGILVVSVIFIFGGIQIFRINETTPKESGDDPAGAEESSDGLDTDVRLWNLGDLNAEPVLLQGHQTLIKDLAFDNQGRWLASGDHDGAILLWDLSDLSADPVALQHTFGLDEIAFDPNGRWLASAGSNDDIWLWDLDDLNATPLVLEGLDSYTNCVAFDPQGRWLASGSLEGIQLWDLEDLNAEPILLEHEEWVKRITYDPQGRWLVSILLAEYEDMWFWDLENLDDGPKYLPVYGLRHNTIANIAFDSQGRWLSSGSWSGEVRLWDLEDLSMDPVVLEGHKDRVYGLDFDPQGRWLASGSSDGDIRLWDLEDLNIEPTILKDHSYVRTIAFDPQGRWLASGGE